MVKSHIKYIINLLVHLCIGCTDPFYVLCISVMKAHHPYLLNVHSVYHVLGTQLKVKDNVRIKCLFPPTPWVCWQLTLIAEWIRAVFLKDILSWMNKQIRSFNTI